MRSCNKGKYTAPPYATASTQFDISTSRQYCPQLGKSQQVEWCGHGMFWPLNPCPSAVMHTPSKPNQKNDITVRPSPALHPAMRPTQSGSGCLPPSSKLVQWDPVCTGGKAVSDGASYSHTYAGPWRPPVTNPANNFPGSFPCICGLPFKYRG